MITSSDIRKKEFSKAALGGYKPDEVNVFLDEISADLDIMQRENIEFERKIEVLASKIEDYRQEEGSIQTAVLNAQRLSDQIIKDANQIAEETISNANKQAFDTIDAANFKADNTINDASDKADNLTKTSRDRAEKMLNEATAKTQALIKNANESLARQHKLFYSIKGEVSKFRALLLAQYKNHLDIIDAIPDEVDTPPPYEKELEGELANFNYAKIDDINMETSVIEIEPVEFESYLNMGDENAEPNNAEPFNLEIFSSNLEEGSGYGAYEEETALNKIKSGE